MPLTISEYVKNRDIRHTLPRYRYHGNLGMGYYLSDEVESHEEIKAKYPIEGEVIKLGTRYKGENPDKTKVQ